MNGKIHKDLSKLPQRHLISIIDSLIEKFGSEAAILLDEILAGLKICWFIKLPSDTFSSVITEWLSLKEISRLDLAFCTRNLRPQFQIGLSSDFTAFSMLVEVKATFDFPLFTQWITIRNVKLKQLDVSLWNTSGLFCDQIRLYIENCGTFLQDIDLSNWNDLPESLIEVIVSCCPRLESLRICNCLNVPQNLIASVLSQCSGLKELSLPNASALENNLWPDANTSVIKATRLERLDFGAQSALHDDQLCAILAVCNRLQQLNIRLCVGLSDVSFGCIATGCPSLRQLVATDTVIQDAHIVELVRNAPALDTLCVSGCAGLTRLTIQALLSHTHLIHLEIAHNQHLTDEHMTRMHTSFPGLLVLQVDGCSSLTPAGVLSVVQHCAVLRLLSAKLFGVEFDSEVRRGIIEGKHWLGKWKDRKLTIHLSTV